MLKLKHIFCGISFLLCVLFISHAVANTMRRVPLHLKVDESDLVIIGTVSKMRLLVSVTETRKISRNSFSVSFPIEGMMYQIEVEKILLDKRKAIGKITGKLSDVFAFVSSPLMDICEEERNLFFLKQIDIDAGIVKRHQLKQKYTYEPIFARAGTHQLSSKKLSSRSQKRLKRNLQYAEATQAFCDIMKIQYSAERLKRLNGILENPLLKESALAEIERIINPKEYARRYKTLKTENRDLKQK